MEMHAPTHAVLWPSGPVPHITSVSRCTANSWGTGAAWPSPCHPAGVGLNCTGKCSVPAPPSEVGCGFTGSAGQSPVLVRPPRSRHPEKACLLTGCRGEPKHTWFS